MPDDLRKQLPVIETESLEGKATGAIYQAIKDFSARLEDELTLRIGDKVEVISDDKDYNDGWYMGKSLATGDVGLYPKSFTKLVPSLSRPSLLRSRSRRIASPSSSKSNTPVSTRASKFDDVLSSPVEQKSAKTLENSHHINGALSDIERALEELKNDANPQNYDDSSDLSTTESLNPEFVQSWSPEQVTSYFKYLGFDSHSTEQFSKHKITGTILLELELAYLKELDISSFGTRFEIYKEIEALKELSQQQKKEHTFDENDEIYDTSRNSLMAPANITKPLTHQRKKSRSLDDIPESSKNRSSSVKKTFPKPPSSQVPSSQVPSSQVPEPPANDQFLSPRRAPLPPNYPSPILNREGHFSNSNTPIVTNRNSYYESVGHSRKPSYDINPSFQFNNGNNKNHAHSRKSSYEPLQHSRSNSRTQNLKSNSVADLLSTLNTDNRPASSIYFDSGHSRGSSIQKGHVRRSSDAAGKVKEDKKVHRRHSSVFSFLSGTGNVSPTKSKRNTMIQFDHPYDSRYEDPLESPSKTSFYHDNESIPTLDPKVLSTSSVQEKRRSVSNKESNSVVEPPVSPAKRSVSEALRQKTLRNITSSQALKKNNKKSTSAFQEGIRQVTPQESIISSQKHGWMNKRGGIAVGTWKQRYFALHGTRLSYFTSLSDTKERGLIDITSHKVLPAKDDDKLVSLYAATTGNGKFCFKLVPPAPGSKKGLTFTQQKVHYFAVETKEEMRSWMAALIKATIEIDESVPILSSYSTPTVSLMKAQNLLAQARENAKSRERERPSVSRNSSVSPDTDSYDSNLISSQSPNTTVNTELATPNLKDGFSTPFELANTPRSTSSSVNNSPIELELKSKPYNAGTLRHPSSRVANTAAAVALANSRKNDNRI